MIVVGTGAVGSTGPHLPLLADDAHGDPLAAMPAAAIAAGSRRGP